MGMDRKIKQKSWLQKHYIKLILATAFIVFVLVKIVFSDHQSKLRVDYEKITVAEVVEDTFQDYISITGITDPIKTVSLHPLVSGQIKTKLKEEGDMVQKGDIILTMSNPELEQQIIDLEAELEQERINLQQNRIKEEKNMADLGAKIKDMEFSINSERRNFEEKKYEFEQGMIPKNTYLIAKETFEYTLEKKDMLYANLQRDSMTSKLHIQSLENNLKRNEAKFEIEKRKLDDLNVKATVTGRLSSLSNVEIGGQLNKNAQIGYIRDLSQLRLLANIDQHYSTRVARNQNATFTAENNKYDLYVNKISMEVVDGSIKAELLFESEMPAKIRVGQTYHIKLELGQSKIAIIIPRGAFFHSTGGQWIYVMDKSGDFAIKRNIQIGRQNTNQYEIIDGLKPGEKVIVSGYDTFGDVDMLVFK